MEYTIGQIANMFGLTISTLRYYDKEGLFGEIERKSTVRKFHEKDIETDTFAIQKFAHQKIAELPTATKRLVNPDRYPVFLTKNLADLQQKLISEYRNI